MKLSAVAVAMDVRYAARQLRRRPGHTLAVIACLVIGLVTSVATFSLITALFYGDVPGIAGRQSLARIALSYDGATRIESVGGGRRVTADPLSFDDFAIARTLPEQSALEAIGAEGVLRLTAAGHHGPVALSGAFVSADLFKVLRTTPERGRLFAPEDDRADAQPVTVVTDHFWRTQLDGRDDAIGGPVLLGGRSFTVVGVAPPRFHGTQVLDIGQDDSNGVQVWIPLAHAQLWPARPPNDAAWLTVVGRMQPAMSVPDVERQLAVSASRIAASNPTKRTNVAFVVRSYGFRPADTPLGVLAAMLAALALPLIVLAIGCANVANLQLAGVADRSRELAVRLSLGATRGQLLRLLTFETLARVLIAVTISMGSIVLILRYVQPLFPIEISLDWRVMLFAISLAVAVAMGTGLMPAWLVLRRKAAGQLKENAQGGGLVHSRLRSGLVVVQVALSLALLVLTGLFARTVQAMTRDAPAVLRQQLVASFDPAELRMAPLEARQFADAVVARMAADDRIGGVALSSDSAVRFGLPEASRNEDRPATLVAMSASLMDVLDVRLLTGRRLSDADDAETAVLSARAAGIIAPGAPGAPGTPGASPLGMVLRVSDGSTAGRRLRVVGVVADNPIRPTVERPDPVIYVTLPNELRNRFTLRVRAADPERLAADLLVLVNEIDPRVTWTSIRRGDMRFQDEANEMSSVVYAVGTAGVVAVLLSATGLYAVMSYIVTLRRREIGVRLAIGAPPARIISLMLGQAMRLVLIGIACGLVVAVPMAFVMRATFVASVDAGDPMVFLPTMALLFMVGAAASIIPAVRAARVEPIVTLRHD